MPKLIKLSALGAELKKSVKRLTEKELERTNKVIRATIFDVWTRIMVETPVDKGFARGAWMIGGQPTNELGSKNKNKGGSYVQSKTPKNILGKKLFLFNNLPYIQKLEFGRYGNKPTEKVTARGFSRLAPKGMVRVNLIRWKRILKKFNGSIK